jgi:histidine triad (HIT) family protein
MSMIQGYDANEVFAQVLRGGMTESVVHEDREFLAFVDFCPHAEEHVAVIAKAPITLLAADPDPQLADRLSFVTHKLVVAVCEAWQASSVIITEHNDLVPFPTVQRLHVLILPGWRERSGSNGTLRGGRKRLRELAQLLTATVA